MEQYLKTCFLGMTAVLVLNGFFSFSSLPIMFASLVDPQYVIYAQAIYGFFIGASIQFFRSKSPVNPSKNIFLDLRYALALLVFTMFITYLCVFGSYLTYFPMILFCSYYLSLAIFSASMFGNSEQGSSIGNKFFHLTSALILGGSVASLFWYMVNTSATLVDPLFGQLWLWCSIGAISQTLIVATLHDFKLNVSSQWAISLAGLATMFVSLWLIYQPYLGLVLFTAMPIIYSIVRTYASDFGNKEVQWHRKAPVVLSNEIKPRQMDEKIHENRVLNEAPYEHIFSIGKNQ